MDFNATFQYKDGTTITKLIPGHSQADAEQFAQRCAKLGYRLVSVTPISPAPPSPRGRNNRYQPTTTEESLHDFDKLGMGIGGINRYQPTAAEEMAQIDAQIRHMEREEKRVRRGMRGQLWEPCWCGTEPVCAHCSNCERHCDC